MRRAGNNRTDALVLVTGGTSGIGRAVVRRLCEEGVSVAVVSRAAFGEPKRGDLIGVTCDLRDREAVRGAIETIEQQAGKTISGVVNSAGVIHRAPFVDQSASDWEEMVQTNLFATMHVCQEVSGRMVKSGTHGSIVNIASVAGLMALQQRAVYSASKAAVIQLTRCLALELAGCGIRINVVCPGAFCTPMIESGLADPETASWYKNQIPMGRVGRPEECASIVSFLLSDESSYISGATITVDGAWSVS